MVYEVIGYSMNMT